MINFYTTLFIVLATKQFFCYIINPESKSFYYKLFEIYTVCIENRNRNIKNGLHRSALIVEQYNSITLKCNACRRLDLVNPEDYIIWKRQYKSQANADLVNADFDKDKFHLNENRDELTIHNAGSYDEGHYWCEIYNTLTVVNDYFVTVLPGEIKIPVFENASRRHLLNFDKNMEKYDKLKSKDFNVYVTWYEWSECSSCNKPSIRIRIGYCYLNVAKTSLYKKQDFKIFEYYKNSGLPCHSSLISLKLKIKLGLNKLKSFTMYGDCNKKCFTTTESYSNLGSTEKNSNNENLLKISDLSKIQHLHNFLPKKIPFMSNNQLISTNIGSNLRLRCITASKTKSVELTDILGVKETGEVYWKFNDEIINNAYINYRNIKIDNEKNTLHINNIKPENTGTYSCYKNDRLIAIIKVRFALPKKFKEFETFLQKEMKQYEQYLSVSIGSIIMISTFMVVLCYSFLSRATRRKI